MLILSEALRYRLSNLYLQLQQQDRILQTMIQKLSCMTHSEAQELKIVFDTMLQENRYQLQYIRELIYV